MLDHGVLPLEDQPPASDAAPKPAAPCEPAPNQPVTGILPSQELRRLCGQGAIRAVDPITEDQIQPASLDLRLGAVAYRVRASFLPGEGATVRQKIDALAMHELDLAGGAVLEKGCVYIVPLKENLDLRKRYAGIGNPKSSTGRLDIFTRLITDHASAFDTVRSNYKGPLYAELSPRTFSVVVREGDRLCQLRLRYGSPSSSGAALWRLHEEVGLTDADLERKDIADGRLPLTVDLAGMPPDHVVGYRAKPHADLIDVSRVGHYAASDFWDPVRADPGRRLILNPGDFYILVSKETVKVPPTHAAEMVAYDTLFGEFRVHYAGFFDPGFGDETADGAGSRAVLEVRSHEVPFLLEDGQPVGSLVYERLATEPDKLYGAGIGSTYQRQGLALAKQFKR